MDIIKNVVGNNIQINDSNGDRIVDIELQGNTTQEGTPTPDSPIPINVVSGRQEVVVCEKNLFKIPLENGSLNGITWTINENGSITLNGTSTGHVNINSQIINMPVVVGETYTISATNLPVGNIGFKETNGTDIWVLTANSLTSTKTITSDMKIQNIKFAIYIPPNRTLDNITITFQLEKGSTASEYEAFKGQSYEINLGKNLLPNNASSQTKHDIVFTKNEDGSVYAKGTASALTQIDVYGTNANPIPNTFPNGTYTLSGGIKANQTLTIKVFRTGGNNYYASSGTGVSFTIDNNTTGIWVYLNIANGQVVDGTFYPMLEKGSSASSYSPYKTPIELCKIGTYQDFIKKGTGKNLYDSTMTFTYRANTNVGEQDITNGKRLTWAGNTNTSAQFLVYAVMDLSNYVGHTIRFKTDFVASGTNKGNYYIGLCNADGTNRSSKTSTNVSGRTISFVVPELVGEQTYLNVCLYVNASGTLETNDYVDYKNITLTIDDSDMTYEPYGMYNKWYLEKNIGKTILNGSETWNYGNNIFNTSQSTQKYIGSTITCMSNYFSGGYNKQTASNFYNGNSDNTIGFSPSMIFIRDDNITSKNDFTTWLSTHNTIVYYVLSTPTYTEITDSELIGQLNELGTALLPYGIVNISVSSNDLPTILDLDYFTYNRYISPSDRQALIDGIATIPYKINIVKDGSIIKTLDQRSIVNLDYEDFRYVDTDTLVIGQFVARKINGELDQIYTDFEIEDTELNIQMGIQVNNDVNYYDLGNFLVTKPTSDNVKDKTSFEAMDYTKKFNVVFDGTRLTYPCTAQDLAIECCRQADVELATTIFTNSDIIIDSDQYTENETCRKVMQDIGKLAYSWIRIDWDNKCYIDFDPQDDILDINKLTNHNYYDLSLQKNVFGPVNRVVIGMKDVEGENAVIEDADSIAQNGVTEIKLYDNNITYTPELRQQAITKASKLFGLTFTPLDTNTIGHPWLIGKEKIEVATMEGDTKYTYPFDRTIAYSGHIKSKLTSKADTRTETEYKNTNNLEDTVRQTRIIVDKQNSTITSVVSTANTALSTANTANSTATTANTNANTALSTANSANTNASTALSTANTASSNASTALSTANTANTNASTALSTASTAANQAARAEANADNLRETIPTVYATKSELTQTESSITATVTQETSRGAIVSKINLVPGEILLEGTVTANNNFKVLADGSIEAKNGSFSGDIFLGSGGKVIGGDGLLTNLQFTSVGIIDGWSPLGFNLDDRQNVLYQDLYVDYNIPSNFTIKEAYLTLYTSKVMSSYMNDNYQTTDTTGTPKQLKLYKGLLNQTRQVFWANGTSYFYRTNLSLGAEISSAFGSASYTPSISAVGQVVSVTSIDLTNDLSTTTGNNQLVIRTSVTKPSNFNTTANRKSVAENTGMARMVLDIIGYMSTSA